MSDFTPGYQCWFCGTGIEPADPHALLISLESLRQRGGPDDQLQQIYAHFACAADRMQGADKMALEPDIFFGDTN